MKNNDTKILYFILSKMCYLVSLISNDLDWKIHEKKKIVKDKTIIVIKKILTPRSITPIAAVVLPIKIIFFIRNFLSLCLF